MTEASWSNARKGSQAKEGGRPLEVRKGKETGSPSALLTP